VFDKTTIATFSNAKKMLLTLRLTLSAFIGVHRRLNRFLHAYNSTPPSPTPPVPLDNNQHYENFPVASILLPKHLRRPIEVIYQFARSADDFADEGDVPVATRLANLANYARELDLIAAKQPSQSALFQQLAVVIRTHDLPLSLFHDLLDAFKQDVTKTSYANFAELLDYCRRSANPIGRLLLYLYRATGSDNLAMSDNICSALQLINHWQDVAIDAKKNDGGRVYLPQEDLAYFGLSKSDITNGVATPQWREMMAFQTKRAQQMMAAGAPLSHKMPGRFGAELRLIVAGGVAILDKIDAVDGDIFRYRPQLTKWDWLRIAPAALLKL
jgi:squalene synthase HpnC